MYCPLCEKEVEHWKKHAARENVSCPHCRSAERHRLTALYLKEHKKSYEKFLHIAPEKTLQKTFKEKFDHYICGDLNPEHYSEMNAVFLDATDMQFEGNTFDCVYASHILEHIIEDSKAMSEIYRVLKKGGELMAMVPQNFDLNETYEDFTITSPKEREKHFGQWDHVRYYGPDFSKRLMNSGFYVKAYYIPSSENDVKKIVCNEKHLILEDESFEESHLNLIPDYNRTKYNLNRWDVLYVCIKQ